MNRVKSSMVMMAAAAMMIVSMSAVAGEMGQCPTDRECGPGMMGRGHGPLGPLGRISDELGLTDEQKTEIQAIMAEEMPAARERIKERVDGVLTAEQQAMLEELKADRPDKGRRGKGRGMRGSGGPVGPDGRLERMVEALELTDDQKTAIREIHAEARDAQRAEVQEKIKSVLTPEQQEKAEALREQRRERVAERFDLDLDKE